MGELLEGLGRESGGGDGEIEGDGKGSGQGLTAPVTEYGVWDYFAFVVIEKRVDVDEDKGGVNSL